MPDRLRRTAILTRRREDNARVAQDLRASGMEVLELPCVRVQLLEDISALADAIHAVAEDDWLVVTSRAGADAVARAARPGCRVAAVGRVTAARLAQHGI